MKNFAAILITGLMVASSQHAFAKPKSCESSLQTISPLRETVQRLSMRPSLIKTPVVAHSLNFSDAREQVAIAVSELKPAKDVTEAVLYPFSGFDFSTPLALFPNAKTFIMVDQNSIIDHFKLEMLRKTPLEVTGSDRNRSWVIWKETRIDVFQNIIKSLFAISPKSKIEKIDFIVDEFSQVSLELRFTDGRDGQSKTLHYWAGDAGPLPPEMSESGSRLYPARWWMDDLIEMAPRTILLKGSHSLFRLTNSNYSPKSLRETFIAGIRQNGGLVVEGASDIPAAFDADWVKEKSSRLKPDRTR